MEIETKIELLNVKILQAVGEGKIEFNENMTIKIAKKNLNIAIKLEEYKAAQKFKNYIDKNDPKTKRNS